MGSEIKCSICRLFKRYQQIHYRYQQPSGIKPLSTAYLFRHPKYCGLERRSPNFGYTALDFARYCTTVSWRSSS